jgi:hypothetical protein
VVVVVVVVVVTIVEVVVTTAKEIRIFNTLNFYILPKAWHHNRKQPDNLPMLHNKKLNVLNLVWNSRHNNGQAGCMGHCPDLSAWVNVCHHEVVEVRVPWAVTAVVVVVTAVVVVVDLVVDWSINPMIWKSFQRLDTKNSINPLTVVLHPQVVAVVGVGVVTVLRCTMVVAIDRQEEDQDHGWVNNMFVTMAMMGQVVVVPVCTAAAAAAAMVQFDPCPI